MKEKFPIPECQVLLFQPQDVVTASPTPTVTPTVEQNELVQEAEKEGNALPNIYF